MHAIAHGNQSIISVSWFATVGDFAVDLSCLQSKSSENCSEKSSQKVLPAEETCSNKRECLSKQSEPHCLDRCLQEHSNPCSGNRCLVACWRKF